MPAVSLVVLDLDGTLLDPDREAPIRPAVREAVRRTLERGVGVTLATGRTWEYAQHRCAELGLTLPIVAGQGSSLAARDGRILWEHRLDDALAARLAGQAGSLPQEVCFYFRHRLTHELAIRLNRSARDLGVYLHLLGKGVEVDADLAAYLKHWAALKFVVFDESEDGVARWSAWSGPEASVMRTHHLLVEGTAPGVNKGNGLRRLLQLLEQDPAETLVIGDNFNDLPMFEVAGTAVAMGQAPAEVQARAAWVAPSFLEDGVAAALERYVLRDGPPPSA